MDPIEEINIREVGTPSWMYTTPSVPDNYVPVTINLGFPVVDLPGCVEYHQDNKKDYLKKKTFQEKNVFYCLSKL